MFRELGVLGKDSNQSPFEVRANCSRTGLGGGDFQICASICFGF